MLLLLFSHSVISSSVTGSMTGFSVLQHLPELAQTRIHWVSDAIQPPHPLSSTSPPFNLFQHQGLFKWVTSSHQMAKVLKFQLQHQSFQWISGLISFRIDWLDLLAVQGTLRSLQRFTHGGIYICQWYPFNWSPSTSPAVSTSDFYIGANIVLKDIYGI